MNDQIVQILSVIKPVMNKLKPLEPLGKTLLPVVMTGLILLGCAEAPAMQEVPELLQPSDSQISGQLPAQDNAAVNNGSSGSSSLNTGTSGSNRSNAVTNNSSRTAASTSGGNAAAKQQIAYTKPADGYKDGTYAGSAQGYGGTVSVKVTISGGKITGITITSAAKEDYQFLQKAKNVIPRIISAQTPNVDAVSGATYSSNGIINAVKNALSKAGNVSNSGNGGSGESVSPSGGQQTDNSGSTTSPTDQNQNGSNNNENNNSQNEPVNTGKYANGNYSGSCQGFGGKVDTQVTVKDGMITAITILSAANETPEYLTQAKKVIQSMLTAQGTDVDTVSGATYTSRAIINGVKEALNKAAAAAGNSTEPSHPSDNTEPADNPQPGENANPSENTEPADDPQPGENTNPSDNTEAADNPQPGENTNPSDNTEAEDNPQPGGNTNPSDNTEAADNPQPGGNTNPSDNTEAADNPQPGGNTNPSDKPDPSDNPQPGENTDSSDKPDPSDNPQPGENTDPSDKPDPSDNPQPGENTDPGTEPENPVPRYADGTYTGSAQGWGGIIKLKVVIENDLIKTITITSSGDETPSYFNSAKNVTKKIIKKQSTDVDTVTGATYSSRGIIDAVKEALSKASAAAEEARQQAQENASGNSTENGNASSGQESGNTQTAASGYADGDYTGTANGWGGSITMRVSIRDGLMTAIDVISAAAETDSYMKAATKVTTKMLAKQKAEVDVVTGATYSSRGIINAVKQALEKSKEAADAAAGDNGAAGGN